MSTSNNTITSHLIWSLVWTVFLVVFGAVYELFSHGVYSYYMIYAFAIPLVMGVIPYTIMVIRPSCRRPASLRLYNSAIAAFTTGCMINGVLDIYGTTNGLVMVYPAAGVILLILGLLPVSMIRGRSHI